MTTVFVVAAAAVTGLAALSHADTICYDGRYTGSRGSDPILSRGRTLIAIDAIYVDRRDTVLVANNPTS